jgi:hypothetical protein
VKTIDIFGTDDTKRTQRIYRNSKILYSFAKVGAKGLSKINPVTVYADAIISIGDAIYSYLNYRGSVEYTKQLEIKLDAIKHEYNNILIELELQIENKKSELSGSRDEIESKLELKKADFAILKKIYDSAKENFVYFQEIIKVIRQNQRNNDLKRIETLYYDALQSSISASIAIIGG